MPNPDREFDKTHLSLDWAEERLIVHRDFLAHSMRWSHVVKYMMQGHRYQGCHLMDVGCGKDLPLPRLMYANRMTGFDYSGFDINKIPSEDIHPSLLTAHNNGKARIAIYDECDASTVEMSRIKWGPADVLVCFECLEHIAPYIVARMLRKWKDLVKPGGTLFVSTPVYNGSAAANHISEWGHVTLGKAFEFHGFTIVNRFGTFASQSDLKRVMTPEHSQVFEDLRRYYDTNALSIMLAPLYPNASRNILWVLKNEEVDYRGNITPSVHDACQNPNAEEIFNQGD